jgi:rhodanese-related sulfurtransferase
MLNVIVLVLVLLAAFSQIYPWLSVRWVSARDLATWLEQPGTVIADLRQASEYQAGHLPGAVSVPIIRVRQMSQVWSRDTRIVLVDRSGYRSLQAFQSLTRRGFQNLYCLRGGMLGWLRYRLEPSVQSRPSR